jgi:hypothetical protein
MAFSEMEALRTLRKRQQFEICIFVILRNVKIAVP